MVSVCLADRYAVFRGAVRRVIAQSDGFDVFEAGTESELEDALVAGVDVVLVDEGFFPEGGVGAARLCVGRCAHVVVWASEPDPARVLAALRAGAAGYLKKEISPDGLVRALRGTAKGESPLSRDLSALMIAALHQSDARDRTQALAGVLSARERQVLDLIALGSRNKQIAVELSISEFTVKRHVQNILQKLELPSRRAAAAFYRSLGASPEQVLT
jgi:DNA-binding NarL/FixJ family response regulator